MAFPPVTPFTQIPPIQCLVTFEAVARLRSASRAADELCVTVSAVSHRLRQLEAQLGVKLFTRNDFTLTSDGAHYLHNVCAGLAALGQLPAGHGRAAAPRLRVAVTPSFSRQLLMPRLERFRNAYPDVELTLQVSIPLLDVTAEEADLEIRFGTGGYPDREYRRLLDDVITPACSPAYLNEHGPFDGFRSEAEFARVRLMKTPLEPWAPWFAGCSVHRAEPEGGAQFNDLGLVYDAAASGFGVALVRHRLGAAWFDSGRLLPLSTHSVPSPHSHYLCWRPGTLERWECAAFVDWLTHVLAA